jgi:hypothetical protein
VISARRAALLGLGAPLSVIMAAVLGLWPEEDQAPPVAAGGGVSARPSPRPLARPRPAWRPSVPMRRRQPEEDEEALLLCGALG